MTHEEIQAMPAEEVGRRLLEGLGYISRDSCPGWVFPPPDGTGKGVSHVEVVTSVDSLIAFVCPPMHERGWDLLPGYGNADWWRMDDDRYFGVSCDGYAWPEAACRAALLALEGA